jgi:hypothetical protein
MVSSTPSTRLSLISESRAPYPRFAASKFQIGRAPIGGAEVLRMLKSFVLIAALLATPLAAYAGDGGTIDNTGEKLLKAVISLFATDPQIPVLTAMLFDLQPTTHTAP